MRLIAIAIMQVLLRHRRLHMEKCLRKRGLTALRVHMNCRFFVGVAFSASWIDWLEAICGQISTPDLHLCWRHSPELPVFAVARIYV